MKTIVVTSQKGGSGKTTLVAHLAVEAERTGDAPAWMIDTDKQGTLSVWHRRREDEIPKLAQVPLASLSGGIAELARQRSAFCFVDTAPTISDQSAAVLRLADLVLIPVRPSPADLWAVAETLQMVKAAGKRFMFVVTQAKMNTKITAQTVAALSQHGRVAESFITDRVPYAAAMTGGRTATELAPNSPAAEEVSTLWAAVKTCFHENMNSMGVAHG
jgi:chromosome partitioning protein